LFALQSVAVLSAERPCSRTDICCRHPLLLTTTILQHNARNGIQVQVSELPSMQIHQAGRVCGQQRAQALVCCHRCAQRCSRTSAVRKQPSNETRQFHHHCCLCRSRIQALRPTGSALPGACCSRPVPCASAGKCLATADTRIHKLHIDLMMVMAHSLGLQQQLQGPVASSEPPTAGALTLGLLHTHPLQALGQQRSAGRGLSGCRQ